MDIKSYEIINGIDFDFKSELFYVYELQNSSNNMAFYVGKGRDNRLYRHISLRNSKRQNASNPHKCNTINKILRDGDYVKCVLVYKGTEEECFIKEMELIKTYGRRCDGSGQLTNITEGGEGKRSGGIPVSQYTMWGEFIRNYDNAKQAARENGWATYSAISQCCYRNPKYHIGSYKGFLWSYTHEDPKILTFARPVYQWSLDGTFLIKIHNNCSQAARDVNCDPSTINDHLHGHIKQAVGFLWSYDDNPPSIPKPHKRNRKVVHIGSGIVFDTVSAAARFYGVLVCEVSEVCKNLNRKGTKGHLFRYVDDL